VLDKLLSTATTNAKLLLAAAAGAALVAGGSAVAITNVSDSGSAGDDSVVAALDAGEHRSDTATAKIATPKASKSPKADKPEGERKDNHGACVSAVAKATPAADADPNAHGKLVSETAKSDCGKTANGNSAEAKKKAADKKAEHAKTGDADDADDDGTPSSTGVERSGGRAGGK
jgi:hypothetical protein